VLIIDKILAAPGKALMSIFMEIYNAAIEDRLREAEALRGEISRLYLQLESGAISEADFDAREQELLDRLDAAESRGGDLVDEDEESGDDLEDQEPYLETSADLDAQEDGGRDAKTQQPPT
jgi:gas vesicle protein GvpG